jgi:hypothetical protein
MMRRALDLILGALVGAGVSAAIAMSPIEIAAFAALA